jgi:sphinganine-1-phosphate aldolase
VASTRKQIPSVGTAPDEVLRQLEDFREGDARYRDGKTWSLVYYVDEAHHDFLKRAHNTYFAENALNPMAFPSLRRMEAEIVQMTSALLNGGEGVVGSVTSGGTESLLLAVKAARERARRRWPWIRRPNMVLPRSVHAAMDKASHYFGVKARYVDTSPDFRADVRAMAKACDRNTILLAGSAPSYPQSTIDPIEELGRLALRKKLPLHVDACFGGFMLPWLERLGHPIPPWDFRVPGVTSISADLHKYGYASKGASVLLHLDMDRMKHQFFISTDWTGGIYASVSIPGTRPGGPIAAAWAALHRLGEDGYLRLASEALEATRRLRAGIEDIPQLKVLGSFHMTAVTFASIDESASVYAVSDLMAAKGWGCDRQQRPASIHLTVNANNAPVVEQYLSDLRACAQEVEDHPELCKQGEAAVYGMMAKVPIRRFVKHGVSQMMQSLYSGDGSDFELADQGDSPLRSALDRASEMLGRRRSA